MKLFKAVIFKLLLLASGCLSATEIVNVTIYADDGYPPYSYIENGELKGLYVDLIMAAAKKMSAHYNIKLIGAPWKRALMEVEEGRALAVMPPYKHYKRRPYISPYSEVLLTETVVAYCHKDIDIYQYLGVDYSASGRVLNVGINSGYMVLNEKIRYAVEQGKINIHENKSTDANIKKLHSNRIDCYVNDSRSILWQFNTLENTQALSFDDFENVLTVMERTTHIGYSNTFNSKYPYKDDFVKKMDAALNAVSRSSTYEMILAQYADETSR